MHRFLGAVFASTALLAAACGGSNSNSNAANAINSTTTPTVAVTPDMFTGTVDSGGTSSNPFTVAISNSPINIILTAAGPPATIFMGLGIGGVQADGTCQLFSGGTAIVQASTTAQIAGTVNAGKFCVMVYDVGNITTGNTVTYSVTVNHY
jgi:hypothetical protein